ncbi:MAG: ankyrin repeat domain-containing protein [Bacteroidetes bacterium]|nr:ankyrin repeat domain-containing protein [Bacteroidota bacterium]
MTRQIKTTLMVTLLLLISQLSFAGATEDLFTALKASKDKEALAAIAAGADVKFVDPSWGTALYCASIDAGPEVIKALIDAKSELNWTHPANGYTALIGAAHWGNADAIKLLLAAGADVKMKDKFGRTILSEAVTCGKLEVVKLLVEGGADPNEKYSFAAQPQSALMALIPAYSPAEKINNLAEIRGKMQGIGFTFSDNFINQKESDFSSLGDIAAYLISKGADPNFRNGGWGCVLNQAIQFKKSDIAKAILNAKPDLKTTMRLKGSVSGFDATPLMLASLQGYNELVEMMCESGADVNVSAKEQNTTTTISVGVGSTTTYSTTVRKYNTALSVALDNNKSEAAAILRKYGAKEPK